MDEEPLTKKQLEVLYTIEKKLGEAYSAKYFEIGVGATGAGVARNDVGDVAVVLTYLDEQHALGTALPGTYEVTPYDDAVILKISGNPKILIKALKDAYKQWLETQGGTKE